MTGAAREPDQADFDLERFVAMFDEALSSTDPRVIDALRNLLMIVTLTRPESSSTGGRHAGPLRRIFDDMHHLGRRLYEIEETLNRMQRPAMEEKSYNWSIKEQIATKASADLAQTIDQDIINQIKREAQARAGFALPEKVTKGLR